ncbi:MAG TPA: PH domain-containing protein [Patescibacteria group bacterium]|nr:PH domain-containing protein [Patescibacteria group bacterium]
MSLSQLFTPHTGEKLEFSLRRHPIVFVGPVFVFLLLAAIPYVAKAVIFSDAPLTLPHPFLDIGLKLLVSVYYLGIWIFFFSQFTDYYLDINIVTNDRIIDINQKGLFGRSVAELDLTRVQDVHSTIKGIIPTMLNFGTVEVQTAATEENFVFEQIHDPHKVRQRILELAALDRKREAREVMGKENVDVAAAGHNEMKNQGLG